MAKKRVGNGREGSWALPVLISRSHRLADIAAFGCIFGNEQQKRRTMGDIDADHKARKELYREAE